MRRRLLIPVLLALVACDVENPATEIEIRSLEEAVPPGPVRVDPCGETPTDPGFVLTPERVFVPDLCISKIANVDGCWFSDYEDEIDLPNAPELEIWCEFACPPDVLDISRTTASFPEPGEPAEHYSILNPCPE